MAVVLSKQREMFEKDVSLLDMEIQKPLRSLIKGSVEGTYRAPLKGPLWNPCGIFRVLLVRDSQLRPL